MKRLATRTPAPVFPPAPAHAGTYVPQAAAYQALYQQSINDPDTFWATQARKLTWERPWTKVCEADFSTVGTSSQPYVRWFIDGKLNAAANCLDRHVAAGRGQHPALVWQGELPMERRILTYQDLLIETCRLANVLKSLGIGRGERVTIYLPLIPEAVIAMLACARIGAIHSVVFSAFSAAALAQRVADAGSRAIITADAGHYNGQLILLKAKVDQAITPDTTVEHVLVVNHTNVPTPMQPDRDLWWHEAVSRSKISVRCAPTLMDAEDPLFTLYTSGSTGQPKGVLHTTAGYLLGAHVTLEYLFDIRPGDIHWCTADVGWITGHSYVVYGPLSLGITTVLYEGQPTFPTPDRLWAIIARVRPHIFYTAPTAIRSLMVHGDDWPKRHDLSSLRVLGTVGEPINEAAWLWYWRTIGGRRCPVIDTWWQTETGSIMIAPFATATALKPGCATVPFFGVVPKVLRDNGTPAAVNESGALVITKPWPSMIRGVLGDPTHQLIKQTYFSRFPGAYFTGDGAKCDADGNFWLLGRIDDVINVSAHRFATAELESILTTHPSVAEAAVIGVPHPIKGHGIWCFVTPTGDHPPGGLEQALITHLRAQIGPIATPEKVVVTPALPKTRSGKIMRRILRAIATGQTDSLGDTTTLADPGVVTALINDVKQATGAPGVSLTT